MKKRWPKPPVAGPPIIDDSLWTGPMPVVPNTAQCKHGLGDCETCGTTNRRDVLHTTEGGRGAVGKLVERTKKVRSQ